MADAGNDRQAALTELADKFGAGTGRAEALIDASRARYQGDLGRVQNLAVDEEATEDLDLDDVGKAAGLKKGQVISATVRGDGVLYAYEGDGGRVQKDVLPVKDLGKKSTAKK